MRKRFEHFVKDNIVKHVNDSLVRSQSMDLDEGAGTGTFSDKMRETFGFSAELANIENIDKVTEYAIDLQSLNFEKTVNLTELPAQQRGKSSLVRAGSRSRSRSKSRGLTSRTVNPKYKLIPKKQINVLETSRRGSEAPATATLELPQLKRDQHRANY